MSESTAAVVRATAYPDSPGDLLLRYADGGAVLRGAIAGLDAEALRSRPIAGKMSSLEVLCHIVDADQFMCDRMKRTIGTQRPLLIGVEAIDYLKLLHYHDRDPELDIRLLETQREQMAADLARIPSRVLGTHGHSLGGRGAHASAAAQPCGVPPRVARRGDCGEAHGDGAVAARSASAPCLAGR